MPYHAQKRRNVKDARTGLDPEIPGDHVKMMNSPDLWPMGGFLPLERPRPAHTAKEAVSLSLSEKTELGVIINAAPVRRFTVYRLNMMDGRILEVATTGDCAGAPFYDYADAQGVFDAGWRVA
jgi:hypothetical protein